MGSQLQVSARSGNLESGALVDWAADWQPDRSDGSWISGRLASWDTVLTGLRASRTWTKELEKMEQYHKEIWHCHGPCFLVLKTSQIPKNVATGDSGTEGGRQLLVDSGAWGWMLAGSGNIADSRLAGLRASQVGYQEAGIANREGGWRVEGCWIPPIL